MLQRITLHLARSPEFPEGSSRHGYQIVAPLDCDGRLFCEEWRDRRAECRVRRFWAGEPDRFGVLVHRPGGPDGATWFIDYDPDRQEDDEAGYRLGIHAFTEGEYVSIKDEDGDLNTFRVDGIHAIEPARAPERMR